MDIYKNKCSGDYDYNQLDLYFKEEYELDYLIANLGQKNVATVTMWNGLVMGGGVGLSINSQHKVACE